MSAGYAMLAYMVIREATAADWPAIWPILSEVGTAGETLTWEELLITAHWAAVLHSISVAGLAAAVPRHWRAI
jgi:hypothetical protein